MATGITVQLVSSLLLVGALSANDKPTYVHEIYVDPNHPNSSDSEACYIGGIQHPCADINFALASPNRQLSTKFYLSTTATHYLKNNATTTEFDGALLVAFAGDNGTAVVECIDGAGLAFVNSMRIAFDKVSIQKCGARRNSTNKDFTKQDFTLLQFRVSLYFYNCKDVTMVNMSVLNSTEAVGVVMYSTAGMNTISHSQFDGNRISESNRNESGGGGFAVEFNYCKPGDNSCNSTNHQTENNQNAVYIFEHCSFNDNRAIDQSGHNQTDISVLPHNETHFSLGRGGGLSLYFKGLSSNITVNVSDCHFYRNSASWGGGMIVEYVDSTVETSVNILESRFIENQCYYDEASKGGPGGGVRIATFVYYTSQLSPTVKRNSILFEWCEFTLNKALFGGALSISFHLQSYSVKEQLFQAYVAGTSFQLNRARLGSAVSVDRDHYFTTGELGEAIFDGCAFNNNTIVYVDPAKPYSVGIGALYISEITVTFRSYLYFIKNNGTALAIVGTTVSLSESTLLYFKENIGSSGGAIALLGMSNIIVGRNTNLTFLNNYAKNHGGALFNNYIGKEDLRSSIKCFLQYFDPFTKREKWKTLFYFQGNRAGKLGNSIFSTTILPCLWSEGFHHNHDSVFDIFCWNNSIWVYKNSTCTNEISTHPRSFHFSDKNMGVFPGKQFQLQIQAVDDLEHNVSADTIYTATVGNTSVCQVDPKYTYIADGYVEVTGEEEQTVTLDLNTAGTRDWHLQLNLALEKCPPGFVAVGNHSESTCDCLDSDKLYTFRGNLLCDKTNLVSKITNGYWIGFVPAINNVTLYMGTTSLLHKYSKDDTFALDRRYEHLNYNQCSYLHRTGPLCGECIEGYSTAVNSYNYECVPCTSNTTNLAANIAIYVSLTYLPYLIVFIVIIIFFDVRLMSGPLVGFILYAQMIGSGVIELTTNSLPYSKDYGYIPRKLQSAYRLVYGVFNLNSLSELMDPFCVHQNFSALDVISLDYVVAVLPLLLIPICHLGIKVAGSIKCRRRNTIMNINHARAMENINKPPEKSMIHAFVGFMYLSYTKFTLASTKVLSTTEIFDQHGDGPNINLIYYAGQYYFGQRQYILPYGLIAIVVFIAVAVVLPFLLLGPFDFMNWLTDKPKFQFLNKYWPTLKINTFLDAFRGCYRAKCWFFTGLYFLFRLIVFIIYAFSTNEITSRVWQLIFLSLLTVLVALFQPYQVKALNYLDVLIFFNLSLINLISIYLYTTHISNVRNGYPVEFYAIGLVLVWAPMVYFLLYLLWHLLRKRHAYSYLCDYLNRQWKRLSSFLKLGSPEERQPLLDPLRGGNTHSELTDSSMFRRAEERSNGVTHTYVDVNNGGRTSRNRTGTYETASSGIATGDSTDYFSAVPESVKIKD